MKGKPKQKKKRTEDILGIKRRPKLEPVCMLPACGCSGKAHP